MSGFYKNETVSDSDVAIIAMSCRFPGADTLDAFWRNLRDGVESVTHFSKEELLEAGIPPELVNKPNYIRAKGTLSDVESFDAAFFGFSPREASQMDPQHRLFLEEAWKIIETAGYNSDAYDGLIALYAGIGMNTYLLNNLSTQREQLEATTGIFPLLIGNDKDYMPTKVSYKLNLKGPSMTVQSACSTSLVATHLACQALLNGECDMALAGGVSLQIPHKSGYLYQEGMIMSPDGHCRAFDADAKGIVYGNGVGIIMLKRLADAIEDGDEIQAVIKGSALNNDGALKVAYTAPSVDGQAAVIAEAQAVADVDAESVTYIEAHGTGTALGDPIEIAALTKAFREQTEKKGFCAIGSVKTNVGHLDTAAAVAGIIKTALALKHRQIPPSLHFKSPNPQINFAETPFYVNTSLADWKTADGVPLRAGVSSFGFGGTNAHVVLEEAPQRQTSGASRSTQLLVLSAKSETALESAARRLADSLQAQPELQLADVAYTLQRGRHVFNQRRMLVCRTRDEALELLNAPNAKQVLSRRQEPGARPVVFMFPGQGAQYVNMARELYADEATFRACVDECSQLLEPLMNTDLRTILYPADDQVETASQQLTQTAITQPAIFVIEYAMAQLFMEWGICPQAVIGHSSGEFAAACIAGVFSLPDALKLIVARGQLMQSCEPGAMLSIPLPEAEVLPFLPPDISVAAINAPLQTVVSGSNEAVDALQQQLTEKKITSIRLHTSHAFHSAMMDPIMEPFAEILKTVTLNPPRIGWVSTVTGTWITSGEATDIGYWRNNLRQTVRFAESVAQFFDNPAQILLEVGPGRTLSTLAARHPKKAKEQTALSSLRHPKSQESDMVFALNTLGKLWLHGVEIDWDGFYAHEERYRVALPTHPFERKKFWIAPQTERKAEMLSDEKKPDIADWFYFPTWKRTPLPAAFRTSAENSSGNCLVFADEAGIGEKLSAQLQQEEHTVATVRIGEAFVKHSSNSFSIDPQNEAHYESLFDSLRNANALPEQIAHLWSVTDTDTSLSIQERLDQAQERGLYSLLALAKAIGKQHLLHDIRLTVVSNNMQDVTGGDLLFPEKATLLGPVKIIPQEYPAIQSCHIDIDLLHSNQTQISEQLLGEFAEPSNDLLIAYRGPSRWIQHFEPMRLEEPQTKIPPRLRENGVYLITGGLGGIGLTLAEYLAEKVHARLILTGRTALPAQEEWSAWLSTHENGDKISQKIMKVRELEALGAQVLVFQADAAKFEEMQMVITQTQQQFGTIHGVLHCAGIPDYAGVIQRRTREDTANVLAPKVLGTLNLNRLLENIPLDFMILFSSIGTILYRMGFGQTGYSAANEFLNVYSAFRVSQKKAYTVAINWDSWQKVGMAEAARQRWLKTHHLLEKETLDLPYPAISPIEGMEAFVRILKTPFTSIIVSTQDLISQLKHNIQTTSSSLGYTKQDHSDKEESHSRPDVSSEYVEPTNGSEKTLVELWQQFLGISQIGIHDDFFELGGDSLLGTQILSRIRETFQIDVPIGQLFEKPTVAGIAEYIEQIRLSRAADREEGEI